MSDTRRNIFDSNHIDTTLSKETAEMLKNLYAYYHKKHYSYETAIPQLPTKKLDLQHFRWQINCQCCGGRWHNPESSCHCNFNRGRSHCQSGGNLQEI